MSSYDVFNVYEDYEPVFGKNYFQKDSVAPKGFDKITVLIPLYNETVDDLKRTLGDLHRCIMEMNKIGGGNVHILIVLDGWNATHETIKEYIKQMYPDIAEQIDNIKNATNKVETYVVQKLQNDEVTYTTIDEDKNLKLSMLIKLDNRRKHNSHAWFLESFVQEMDSDYIFLTDCGTRFDKKCLINLYRGIQNDPSCSAISGRQRVMTAEQQDSSDDFRGYMYRCMQRFDYEASLASFVGCFSIFGMLPVIPGPCGFYRLEAMCDKAKRAEMKKSLLTEIVDASQVANNEVVITVPHKEDDGNYIDAIDFYLKTVSLNPDETGMLVGSLLLAEDRILSYAAVLKTTKHYQTKYEPNACFYFEAETNPTTLLQQRRRWINGTIAGYLWLLGNIGLLLKSKLYFYEKIFLTFLVFSQIMMFIVMSCGVSILTIGIRYPLMSFFKLQTLYVECIVAGYLLVYVIFVYLHSSPKRKRKLNTILFDIITILNVFVSILMVLSLVLNVLQYERIMNIVIVGANCIMPFILAAMHDLTSLKLMITSFIQYVLLLPTFTAFLSVYAFSRMWELTWGNRPSDKLHTIAKKKSEAELQQIKDNLLTNAQGVAWSLVVLNLVLSAVFYKTQQYTIFITILQIFIFAWSTFQMILSFGYFIYKGLARVLSFIGRCCMVCSTSQKKLDLLRKFKKDKEYKKHIEFIRSEMIKT
jgi:cellulose synthase/poly-beta-1,6-N-acetylglucosamine synthase-like glycosyltransferase